MPRLEGKTALITGSTGGIGEATARAFLNEGANVMLVGRSADKLDATRARLGHTDNLRHFVADAVDETSTANAVAATVDAFGGLDILFANAGSMGTSKPFEEQTTEEFDAVMRVNVTGVWLAMKHAVGPMKERGGGSIIATSSSAGLVGFPTMAPYAASKHAVSGLVKTAALELATTGIRVNAIAPGPIDTPMVQEFADGTSQDLSAVQNWLADVTPAKRMGTSDEVANLVVFLASDESSYCTGAVFPVDGGWTTA